MMIDPGDLRMDGGTQPREKIDEDTVADYAEKMRDGATFPPAVVFHDGADYWLADGFHRILAALRCKAEQVEVEVHAGDRREAVLYSVGANATHGLRRSNDDKRRAVSVLLEDELWGRWSDNQIAKRCGVSHPFVASVRSSILKPLQDTEPRKATRNGKEYTIKTKRIGKSAGALLAEDPATLAEKMDDAPRNLDESATPSPLAIDHRILDYRENRLTPPMLAVMLQLDSLAGENTYATPTKSDLAALTGINLDTLSKVLDDLEATRWIRRPFLGAKRIHSSAFVLLRRISVGSSAADTEDGWLDAIDAIRIKTRS